MNTGYADDLCLNCRRPFGDHPYRNGEHVCPPRTVDTSEADPAHEIAAQLSELPDLAGDIRVRQHDRFDRRDTVAFRVDQQLASRQFTAYLSVPTELLADAAAARGVPDVVVAAMDRRLRPWRYPDPNPYPTIDLFPTWTRLQRWAKRRLRRTT